MNLGDIVVCINVPVINCFLRWSYILLKVAVLNIVSTNLHAFCDIPFYWTAQVMLFWRSTCRMKGNTYLEISSTLERRSRELEEKKKLLAFVISALDASEWWFSLRFVCFALGNDWSVPTDFEAANQSKRGAENKSFYHYLEQNPIRSIRVSYSSFTHASILLPFKYSIVSLLTCVPLLTWGNSTEFRKRPLLL